MARTPKTPRQRAEEALAVEQRRVAKIGKRVAALKAELRTAEADGAAANKRLAYLKTNPDLPAPANLPKPPAGEPPRST